MPNQPRKAFELTLSKEKRDELAQFLARAIEDGETARTATDTEIKYWHTIYEQGRTRSNPPWPDAADLTSAIGTEKLDALRDHVMASIFTDTIFTAEGWGDSQNKAPIVEEFIQWQLESVGYQAAMYRAVHLSLIEPKGVIELYEDRLKRPVRKIIKAVLQTDEADGTPIIDASDPEKPTPAFKMNDDGTHEEAQDDQTPQADVAIDSYEYVANGPRPRVIAYRDYLQLPAAATCKEEVWAHAKRFYRRMNELQERAKQGIYDKAAVESLSSVDDRSAPTSLTGEALPASTPDLDRSEKELWEITFLDNLDKTGLRWYVATIAVRERTLLRVQYDDIGKPRYFPIVPYPRPNLTDGYSFIGHKLITVIEEDTAWRNMGADRGAFEVQAPIKRLSNALWDPDDQPFGPRSVIDVRSMDEVQAMEIPRTSEIALEHQREANARAERLSHVNDVASGVSPEQSRTLGEVRMVTTQSMVGMNAVLRNVQEHMEDFANVFLIMCRRRLAEMPNGMELPDSVLAGLEIRGPNIIDQVKDKRIMATMLDGTFKFKPHGSTEGADKSRQRADFNGMLQAVAALAQVNPMIGAIMQTPKAAKALIEQLVRLYNVQDKQAFLGQEATQAAQNVQAPANPDQIKAQAMMAKAQLDHAATLEKTRMDNETKLAVAELGAKIDRLSLFLDERARLGLQDQQAAQQASQQGHEASQADLQRQHDQQMGAQGHAQDMQQSQLSHAQALDQSAQGHQQTLDQMQAQPPEGA